MDIFPGFFPARGHDVFHAIDSQYVLRLQTRHTSPEVGMRTRTRSLSVVVAMLNVVIIKCYYIYINTIISGVIEYI